MKILNNAGIPFGVEATYTKQALNLGYSGTAILDYLYQFTPTINVVPVALTDNPHYRLSPQELVIFRMQCIDFAFDKIEKGEPINIIDITDFIYRIASQNRVILKALCPCHSQKMAVFPNGDVFSCYLSSKEDFKYGNVHDSDFVEEFPRKRSEILPLLCRDRLTESHWFTPLVTHLCMGSLVPDGDRFTLHEDIAQSGLKTSEYLLYRMSKIRDWNTFFSKLQETSIARSIPG